MSGQGEAIRRTRRGLAALIGWALALAVLAPAQAADPAPSETADRPTPSGLPVPRYVILKFDRVNARAGPGDDHRLLWVYAVRNLPVQVVAETAEWRRVCDPEGGLAWVHRRTTDGRRMVMNVQARPVPIFRSADKPKPKAFLNPRAMATLVQCEGELCRIRVDGVSGWAKASDLWGVAPARQCR